MEFYPSELYNLEKNNDRQKIEDYQLDLKMVINDINEIISSFDYSEFIFLETVNYNSELKELFIQVQFYDPNHIASGQNTDFIELLNRIDYILEVDFDEPIPIQVIGEPRAQVQVTLLLDEEAMPKVGDLNEGKYINRFVVWGLLIAINVNHHSSRILIATRSGDRRFK